jgi:hypothetical protein
VSRKRKVNKLLLDEMYAPLPDPPPLKKFKPKYHLPKLPNYKVLATEEYWDMWPKLDWVRGKNMKSQVNPKVLRELGYKTKFPYPCLLEQIVKDIKHGASIGVNKECQIPSTATNAPSAIEEGEKVSDELASWIAKGFVVGPLKKRGSPF